HRRGTFLARAIGARRRSAASATRHRQKDDRRGDAPTPADRLPGAGWPTADTARRLLVIDRLVVGRLVGTVRAPAHAAERLALAVAQLSGTRTTRLAPVIFIL